MNLISETLYAVFKDQKTKEEVEELISFYEHTFKLNQEKSTLHYSLIVVIRLLKDYHMRFTNNNIQIQHV